MPLLIKTRRIDRVAIITLNRPDRLNAINSALMDELSQSLLDYDRDADIGVIVIEGSKKAFAAGADIEEMASLTYAEVKNEDFITKNWDIINRIRKPIIAAVSGHAIGGGCELAMMCDIILAADNAKFSQAEVKVGTIPGIGGTQRLTKSIGKSKAMYYCLSGDTIDAEEALESGLIAKIFPVDSLMDSVLKIAKDISNRSNTINMMLKQSVNFAIDSNISQGIMFERNLFHSTFALEDRKEGMEAFVEKRKAIVKHK